MQHLGVDLHSTPGHAVQMVLKLHTSVRAQTGIQFHVKHGRCMLQAAYTAIEAFQARFPTAGEDAARLKEEVYALLEERAQHAKQRQWRLMQKKRARDEAQANAQSRQESNDAETAVLATVSQAETTQPLCIHVCHMQTTFEGGCLCLCMPIGAVSFATCELGCVSSVCSVTDNGTIWLMAMYKLQSLRAG